VIDPLSSLSVCMHNGPSANIHVHHIDYDRIGDERFSDLMVVCVPCHRKLHKFIDKMVVKGFNRKRVMQKLKPYCVRRIVMVHTIFGQNCQYRARSGAFFRSKVNS
jgi:hypothetical protein